ncbi:MAG: isoprenylcysteine carboxylmethyltransferase family protein [Chloroflexi bacterium]|nr:isoprenylcysteine carboxylmethyltransferase family protein [Chloroflexota bacterium]MYC47717.1 isoprenylcysteine carboxylmethyltransferase family protein [Chloroflexota bacterium]
MMLYLKSAIFAVISQGVFAVLVPLLLAGDRSVSAGPAAAAAGLLFALGVAVYARCAWDFVRFGRGTPAPMDAPRQLVTRGLYRYVRNPMYLAVLAIIAGWAVLFGSVAVGIYGVAIFAFLSLSLRIYEEPRLSRQFGDEYAGYCERVGRWLPRRRNP